MTLTASCSHCGKKFRLEGPLREKTFACTRCRNPVMVPEGAKSITGPDPERAQTLQEQAEQSLAFGDVDTAIRYIEEAIRAEPENFSLLAMRANYYEVRGDDGPIQAFNEMLRVSEAAAQGTLSLSGAIERLRKAAELDAKNAWILNDLAWVLSISPGGSDQTREEAIQLAKRACELSNRISPMHLRTLAAAYARAGRFNDASDWNRRAASLANPEQRKRIDEDLKRYDVGRHLELGPPEHQNPGWFRSLIREFNCPMAEGNLAETWDSLHSILERVHACLEHCFVGKPAIQLHKFGVIPESMTETFANPALVTGHDLWRLASLAWIPTDPFRTNK